jgi:hypothetical protein
MNDMALIPSWRKSSYSNGSGGNCIEVAEIEHGALVRDSKVQQSPVLSFRSDTWSAFVTLVGNADWRL